MRDTVQSYFPGGEPYKSHERRVVEGFYDKYFLGREILDIGGGCGPAIVPSAKIIDIGYPGYDGLHLPFANESQDTIFSSHCLEHVDSPVASLKEWFRTVKVGGFMVITVPHQFLYERKNKLPSRWNGDHKRFYTPSSFLSDIEQALSPNTYRIRSMIENDHGYDYSVHVLDHPQGCYEIEVVIEKIAIDPIMDIGFNKIIRQLKTDSVESVVLCGAGQLGIEILKELKNNNISIDFITDKKINSICIDNEKYQVSKLEVAVSSKSTNFVVASHAYQDEIISDIKHYAGNNIDNIVIYVI